MTLLTNAILTTLVLFLLLLPSFLFIRILKGVVGGDINPRNLYTYLVWGIPLSLLFYAVYIGCGVYRLWGEQQRFPSEVIWRQFFPTDRSVVPPDTSRPLLDTLVVIRQIDSVFRSTVGDRPRSAVHDTLFILHEYAPDSSWPHGQLRQTQVLPYRDRPPGGTVTRRRFVGTRVLSDSTLRMGAARTPPPAPSLFHWKRYLLMHFFILLVLSALLAIVIRCLILWLKLDRCRLLQLQSPLYYLLNGRYYRLYGRRLKPEAPERGTGAPSEPAAAERATEDAADPSAGEPAAASQAGNSRDPGMRAGTTNDKAVQVDVLCEIGGHNLLYTGSVERFKVKDDTLEYLVLKNVCTREWPTVADDSVKAPAFRADLSRTGDGRKTEVQLLVPPESLEALSTLLPVRASAAGRSKEPQPIEPAAGLLYVYASQIRNIYVRYPATPALQRPWWEIPKRVWAAVRACLCRKRDTASAKK